MNYSSWSDLFGHVIPAEELSINDAFPLVDYDVFWLETLET